MESTESSLCLFNPSLLQQLERLGCVGGKGGVWLQPVLLGSGELPGQWGPNPLFCGKQLGSQPLVLWEAAGVPNPSFLWEAAGIPNPSFLWEAGGYCSVAEVERGVSKGW